MQREIYKCLTDLQILNPTTNYELDLRQARDQYLTLAKKYHPDIEQTLTKEEEAENEDLFL